MSGQQTEYGPTSRHLLAQPVIKKLPYITVETHLAQFLYRLIIRWSRLKSDSRRRAKESFKVCRLMQDVLAREIVPALLSAATKTSVSLLEYN
jgi:hypothetical protein